MKLTDHQKLCNKNKAKARARFDGFIRIAEEAYNTYRFNLTPNIWDKKVRENNMIIAKDLVFYLKKTRQSKIFQ